MERKTPIVVKFDAATLTRIDEVVGPRGRSAWIREACEVRLDAGLTIARESKPRRTVIREPGPPSLQSKVSNAGKGECAHRTKDVKTFGTWCADCGARIR